MKACFIMAPEERAVIEAACKNILFVLRTQPDSYQKGEIKRNIERILREGLGHEEGIAQ